MELLAAVDNNNKGINANVQFNICIFLYKHRKGLKMKYKLIPINELKNSEEILFLENGKIFIINENSKNKIISQIDSYEYVGKNSSLTKVSNEKKELKKLTLLLTSTCNLRCKYCYEKYGELATIDTTNKVMNKDVIFDVLNNIYTKYSNGIKYIQFFGGEPLIAFNLIKDIVQNIKENNLSRKLPKTKFGLVTNGVLLNDDILNFCEKESIQITISIDANKDIHDSVRIRSDGTGSYEEVKLKSSYANKTSNKIYFETTINKNHLLVYEKNIVNEWINELKDIGFKAGIIGIVESSLDDSLNIKYEDYYVFKQIIKEFVDFFFVELRNSEPIFWIDMMKIIQKLISKDIKKYQCDAGVSKLAVSTDGYILPCVKLSSQNFAKKDEKIDLITIQNETKLNCKKCWIENFCLTYCLSSNLNNGKNIAPVKCWYMQEITERVILNIVNMKQNNEIYLLQQGLCKFKMLINK